MFINILLTHFLYACLVVLLPFYALIVIDGCVALFWSDQNMDMHMYCVVGADISMDAIHTV